jgi:hypothetical protein
MPPRFWTEPDTGSSLYFQDLHAAISPCNLSPVAGKIGASERVRSRFRGGKL